MKNWLLSSVGVVNGVYFLNYGFLHDSEIVKLSGLILMSFGTVIIRDSFNFNPNWTFGKTQMQRIGALYRLYQMAPQLVENQKRIEQLNGQMQIVESQAARWRTIAQNAIPAFRNSKVQTLRHQYAASAQLSEVLESLQIEERTTPGTLLVVDIGESEIEERTMRDFLDGQVDLEFWISKKLFYGADLLVIEQNILRRDPELASAALHKLSDQYEQILFIGQSAIVDMIELSQVPVAQRVLTINANKASKLFTSEVP